jgi:hypothetical protein
VVVVDEERREEEGMGVKVGGWREKKRGGIMVCS